MTVGVIIKFKLQIVFFFFFERQLTSTPLSTIILYSCLHSMLTQIGHAVSCLDTLPCALSSAWNADAVLKGELPPCSHEVTMSAKSTTRG